MTDDDFYFFRVATRVLYDVNFDAKSIYNHFSKKYGKVIPEADTIRRWCVKIANGVFVMKRKRLGGRPPIADLGPKIRQVLEYFPSASTRFIADFLGVDKMTIQNRLCEELQMKQVSFRWIPHELNPYQKENRKIGSVTILEALKLHSKSGYRNLITGDESWFFYDNQSDRIWIDKDAEPPTKENITIGSKKLMLTVFFSGERIISRTYLSPGVSMNPERFISTVLEQLLLRIREPGIHDPFPEECLLPAEVKKGFSFFFHFFSFQTLICLQNLIKIIAPQLLMK
jgi:predicted Rdx family selenoprotein